MVGVCAGHSTPGDCSDALWMIRGYGGREDGNGVQRAGRTGVNESRLLLTMISPVITSSSHHTSISCLVILPMPSDRVCSFRQNEAHAARLTNPQLKPVTIPVK